MKNNVKRVLSAMLLWSLILCIFLFSSFSAQAAYITNGTEVFVAGNANDDEAVDVRDLVRMKKMIIGSATGNSTAADLNGDSEVNGTDLVLLVGMILEMDNTKWTEAY